MSSSSPIFKPLVIQPARGGYRGFRSRQEFDWWDFTYKNRTVVIERPVLVGTLDDFPQRCVFEKNPGWVEYFRYTGIQCNLTLCREFMASLIPIPNQTYAYVAHVRGRPVRFDLEVLGRIMGIPVMADDKYEFPIRDKNIEPTNDELATFLANRQTSWIGTQFDKANLDPQYRTLWLVVANAIDPTSHTQHLYPWHALVMYAIEIDKPICLVRYIMGRIAKSFDSTAHNDTIKFGVLITRVCVDAGVLERDSDEKKGQRKPLNKSTQARAAGQLRNRPSSSTARPVEEAEGAEEVGADVPGSSRRRRRTSTDPVEDNPMMEFVRTQFEQLTATMHSGFAGINERVDTVALRQEQMEANITGRVREQMEAQQEYMRQQFEAFQARFPQPPPGPDM